MGCVAGISRSRSKGGRFVEVDVAKRMFGGLKACLNHLTPFVMADITGGFTL